METRQQTFGFDAWRRGEERRRAAREELRRRVLARAWGALGELGGRFRWDEAYLFGSVVRPGAFHDRSDVDVAVAGLPVAEECRLVAELSTLVGRAVDVILLDECRFAETIRREGVRWTRNGSEPS